MTQIRKYSRKREAIYNAICASKEHPAAETVYHALKPDYSDLSLGTVYRNLALFKEEGKIISVGVVGGQERFDGTVEPHPHFICTSCGAVLDIPFDHFDDELNAEAQAKTGFEVDEHTLVFKGRCLNCIQKRDK